jgi:hypothetical protein
MPRHSRVHTLKRDSRVEQRDYGEDARKQLLTGEDRCIAPLT